MSTMRAPPKPVRIAKLPCGAACASPVNARLIPARVPLHARDETRSDIIRHDGKQLALVGDKLRIVNSQSAIYNPCPR